MRYTAAIKWICWAVIAVSLVVLVRALPLGDAVAAVRSWVAGLGVWGPLAFGLIYVLAVVAMLPASLLTLAAGATFGLVVGTVTVTLAANSGAALALLIGRYVARSRVERLLSQRPRLAAVDRAIREGGWKIVALLRLSPAVPFNIQNYLYGLTSIGFWTCVLTSAVAMLPGTFLYIYLGHVAGSVTAGRSGRTPAEWTMLGVGLLATLVLTIYLTRLARQKLREQTDIADGEGTPGEFGPGGAAREETSSDDTSTGAAAVSKQRQTPSTASLLITAGVALLLATVAGFTLARPDVISSALRSVLPLGPPSVTMSEQYADDQKTATFDHSAFDAVLQEHVDEDGWVDYAGLAEAPSSLDAYLHSLAEAPFDELTRDEKLALLINAYNACTLRLILDHWPVESIKDIPSDQRWQAARWKIAGRTWSLDQIEHEQIRPRFDEPRIHFALVCAAVGCPPLANRAYTGENLDARLQQQAEYVHTHPTWVQLDEDERIVRLTPLYNWYRGDFIQSAGSVLDFAARFNTDLERLLDAGPPPIVEYLPYDWSLNSQENHGLR